MKYALSGVVIFVLSGSISFNLLANNHANNRIPVKDHRADRDSKFIPGAETQDFTPPKGYIYCALENKSYKFNYRVDVAYGVDGSFLYLYGVKGDILFTNETFGGDPAPNKQKRGYYRISTGSNQGNNNNGNNSRPSIGNILPLGYNWIADESKSYMFDQRVDVAYGVDGSYRFLYGIRGTITFNNETFGGDPAPNKGKKGYYKVSPNNYGNSGEVGNGDGIPSGYSYATDENKSKTFYQKVDLAYGANGSFKFLYGVSGTVTFNNSTFGGDPAPNQGKKGYYRNSPGRGNNQDTENGLPPGFIYIGDENSSKIFTEKVDVAFGADGSFKFKYGVTGPVNFNNAFFGGDPAPNKGKKAYYRPSKR